MSDDRLERIADRLEIQEAIARYARGVDRRDWDLVRSTYHPDAFDDHGDYKGDVDGFIAWVSARHAVVAQSMHFIGNILVELADARTALAETYFVAFQRFGPEAASASAMLLGPGAEGIVDVETLGRYLDRFERRNGEWRVARRSVVFDVIKAAPAAPGAKLKPDWALARRDAQDPLYAARAALGLA